MTDFTALVRQLTSDADTEREAARMTLFSLDEDAVVPLVDQFYAGVNESSGLAIIDVLCEIGGFEALALLEDVYHVDALYESWRAAAERGLRDSGRM